MQRVTLNKKIIILICLVILIIFILAYWYFMASEPKKEPEMSIVIKFTDIEPLKKRINKKGLDVFYKGLNVGENYKIALSQDRKYVLFYVHIYYKDLNLPKNSEALLKTHSILGNKYIELIYPENPLPEKLSNVDTIKGTDKHLSKKVEGFLADKFKSGKIERLLNNLIAISEDLHKAMGKNEKEIDIFLKEILKSGDDINIILEELRALFKDPDVKRDIKSILRHSAISLESISEITKDKETMGNLLELPQAITEVNKNVETVNRSILRVNQEIFSVDGSVAKVNCALEDTNNLLGSTNCSLADVNSKIPKIPPEFIENADSVIKRFDCLGVGLGNMISKRFLLFRFMFGKPGACLKNCSKCNTNCLYYCK